MPMTRRWLAVPMSLAAAALAAAACSGGGSGNGGSNGDDAGVASDTGSLTPVIGGGGNGTGQGFVTDYCNLLGQCCSQSGVAFRGPEECVTQLTNVYLSSTQYTESIGGLGVGIVYS